MDEEELSNYFSAMGRKGAVAPGPELDSRMSQEVVTKASKAAAAKVRSQKAGTKENPQQIRILRAAGLEPAILTVLYPVELCPCS